MRPRIALCSVVPPHILRNIALRGGERSDYLRRFTAAPDLIVHQLAHRLSHSAAGFGASGQPGALAEHFSDVFGLLAKQFSLRQTAADADWIVGAGLFTSRVSGAGIRSMKAPGTAYDDPVLGADRQPSHMRDYVAGGRPAAAFENCGIPNRAFYRAATLLGGYAWEVAGRIWDRALAGGGLGPRAQFRHCAEATLRAAGELFGEGSEPQHAVREAWSGVGVETSAPTPRLRIRASRTREVFEPMTGAAETPHFHQL